jgi:hypothetical protein
MKITMYELFGLIKVGKAPDKIRYDGTIYEYSENDDFYYWEGLSLYREFATNGNCLDNEVEIIEEPKKIEKIPLPSFEQFKRMSAEERYVITAKEYDLLDELIDEINNLKKEK